MAASLALYDLQKGVSGFYPYEKIKGPLVDLQPVIYKLLSDWIPIIAKAVAPDPLAEKVQDEWNEIHDIKQKQAQYNDPKDRRRPDEKSAKTGKELAGKFGPIRFMWPDIDTLRQSLGDRDAFVFFEAMLRGPTGPVVVTEEFSRKFSDQDISQLTGEGLIRPLYTTGALRYVQGSEVKASSSALNKPQIIPEQVSLNSASNNPGGIDFRAMNYLVQPMGSFKDLQFMLSTLSSSALERIDLEQELAALRNMVKAGLVPSGESVKEYLAACFQKGKIEEKQDDLLLCLAEIYRLAEDENLETSPELRESLVIVALAIGSQTTALWLVDTGKFVLLPNNQKVGLN